MQYKKILVCLFTLCIQTSAVHATCTVNFTAVSGSPFLTGAQPRNVAYSPIINNNVFAFTTNNSVSNVSVYQTNMTTGAWTPVTGSPFSTDTGPYGCAFSPLINGNLFAATSNFGSTTVSVYKVNTSTGVFTQVSGSPFSTGGSPLGVAFSPVVEGNLFAAAANYAAKTVAIFSVNTVTGVFTPVSGSPYATDYFPNTVAFSPLIGGNLFVATSNGNTVSSSTLSITVYQVNTTTGVLTPVTGSPFTAGLWPHGIAFTPNLNGTVFAAVANNASNTVSVYQVNTAGAFVQVSGSPFATGSQPYNVSFSPVVGGNLYAAIPNNNATTASVYQVNTTTGAFTSLGTIAVGLGPADSAFSPLLTNGNLFLGTTNPNSNSAYVYQIGALLPTITTLSQYILSGASVTINGTISGGTAPYTITWQDGTIQSGIAGTSFSRTVSPTSSTVYYISTITDTNGCAGGPSNTITIAVRTCP